MTESKRNLLTGRGLFLQSVINVFPKELRLKFNPNRYSIEKFIESSAKKIQFGAVVLDAGAGPCPYKPFFKHCKYESTDFKKTCKDLTFVSSLDKIPRKNNTYDAIICTEVLEHVEHPQNVLNEFNRILKKDGKLIMTVPQGWRIHQEPYNFFYFTKYGLASLLKRAGFEKFKISSKGGYFWFLADALRFNGIIEQYKKYWILYWPLKIFEYPITNIILPFVLFHLDFLDKEKKWTLGYLIEAIK